MRNFVAGLLLGWLVAQLYEITRTLAFVDEAMAEAADLVGRDYP